MIRDINFRGKRKSDGTWLYGDLIHNRGHVYIADDGINGAEDINGYTDFEVDPDTVGQYTGKRDKNGIMIYAGHVITFNKRGLAFTGRVEYSIDNTCFCVKILTKKTGTPIFTYIPGDCTIIGER